MLPTAPTVTVERDSGEPPPPHVAELASFVPLALARDLAAAAGGPNACSVAVHCAVLVSDLAGFTRLTEDLIARFGTAGTERLTRLLNGFFRDIVDTVNAAGGEITTFAGDALIALFRARDDSPESLREAARACASCGLAIRDAVTRVGAIDGTPIAVRVGVGAGLMVAARVGGRRDRWEIVLSGEPLAQVARALGETGSGAVGLSEEAWSLCLDDVVGVNVAVGVHRLEELRGEAAPPATRATVAGVTADDEPILRGIVPGVVRTHLEDGVGGWLSTLRRVTVLFVRLHGLESRDDAIGLQDAVREVQSALYYHGGSLTKVLTDDKGTVVLAAFGLPREPFEYRADYALAAAMALAPKLSDIGLRCDVGVATGTVFCGPIGTTRRREYTIIGSTVNLAARLSAKADGAVICDKATRRAAQLEVRFEALPAVSLKGFGEPITPYRALGLVELAPVARSARLGLAGRDQELDLLRGGILRLTESGRGGSVLVQAEAGVGKSRLLGEAVALCEQYDVRHVASVADRLTTSSSYRGWRPVFRRLLGVGGELSAKPQAQQVAAVEAVLGDDPDRRALAALLNPVLGTSLPMSPHLTEMGTSARGRATRKLLLSLLLEATEGGPTALVFDDVQWLDHASLALLRAVAEDAPAVLLLIGGRPVSRHPEDLAAVLQRSDHTTLKLSNLDPAGARQLIRQVLAVNEVGEHLAAWIHQRADGNAFFMQEITLNLVEEGVLQTRDGVLIDLPDAARLDRTALPDTVETIVTRRIDRLRPAEQLALKAAAVIGRTFDREMLEAVYPEQGGQLLDEALGTILDGRLVIARKAEHAAEDNPEYAFGHRTLLEVVYGSLLGEHRVVLHRACARYLADSRADNLAAYAARLAHHHAAAGDIDEAIYHYEIAAQRAGRAGAADAERGYWERILELHERLPAGRRADAVRQSRWRRSLGTLHAYEGRALVAREHLAAAMALLGVTIPLTTGRRVLKLLGQMTWQMGLLLVPTLLLARSDAKRRRLNELARAASEYCEPCYLLYDNFGFVLAGLTAANFSTRTGDVRVSKPFQTLGYIASLSRLRGLAQRYFDRGLEAARRSRDGEAEVRCLNSVASTHISFGRWELADDWFTRGEARGTELGARHEWEVGMLMWGHADHFRGDYVRALSREQAVHDQARERGNKRHAMWTLMGMIRALCSMDRLDEAAALIDENAALFEAEETESIAAERLTTLARVALAEGRREDAVRHARKAVALINKAGPGDFTTLTPYSDACDLLLTVAEEGGGDAGLLADAATACAGMKKYGGTHPIGAARAHLHRGRLLACRGNAAAATKAWRQARDQAVQHGMPVDEALAMAALGDKDGARQLLADAAPAARRTVLSMAELFTANP